jgi:hypothetical protein
MVMYVSSDCLEVINLMKTKSLCRYIAILLGNDKHTRNFKVVNVQHEGREFNIDAHLVGGMRSHNLLVAVCAWQDKWDLQEAINGHARQELAPHHNGIGVP